MAPEPVLACRDLRRRFGDLVAVDGVGFTIAAGETYGLLGPNGAGKTTTISVIAGLLDRESGDVIVAGRPMTTRTVLSGNSLAIRLGVVTADRGQIGQALVRQVLDPLQQAG